MLAARRLIPPGFESLKAMEIGQNNMTKIGPFSGFSKPKKKQARKKWASPLQNSSRGCCWWNQLQLEIHVSTNVLQWRNQNWTPQGETLLIFKGVTFWLLFQTRFLTRESKTGPSTGWTQCLLGVRFQAQLRAQRHTNQHSSFWLFWWAELGEMLFRDASLFCMVFCVLAISMNSVGKFAIFFFWWFCAFCVSLGGDTLLVGEVWLAFSRSVFCCVFVWCLFSRVPILFALLSCS